MVQLCRTYTIINTTALVLICPRRYDGHFDPCKFLSTCMHSSSSCYSCLISLLSRGDACGELCQVGTDFLEEEITKFEDLVQSVDIAAFNKI